MGSRKDNRKEWSEKSCVSHTVRMRRRRQGLSAL